MGEGGWFTTTQKAVKHGPFPSRLQTRKELSYLFFNTSHLIAQGREIDMPSPRLSEALKIFIIK